MKLKLEYFLLLLLLSNCNFSARNECEGIVKNTSLAILQSNNSINHDFENGDVQSFYDEERSKVKKIITFDNDKITRIREFYINGKLKSDVDIHCCTYHGKQKLYYENGNKKLIAQLKFDKYYGESNSYYSDGNFYAQDIFNDRGVKIVTHFWNDSVKFHSYDQIRMVDYTEKLRLHSKRLEKIKTRGFKYNVVELITDIQSTCEHFSRGASPSSYEKIQSKSCQIKTQIKNDSLYQPLISPLNILCLEGELYDLNGDSQNSISQLIAIEEYLIYCLENL